MFNNHCGFSVGPAQTKVQEIENGWTDHFVEWTFLSTGLPGVPGIVKDGRDGSPGDPGEPGEAGRVGRTGHQGPPGICDTTACQGAAAAGKSSNPKNH